MNDGSVTLSVGSRLLYDGELVEVAEFDGAYVTVRVERTNRFRTLGIGRLVACRDRALLSRSMTWRSCPSGPVVMSAYQRASESGRLLTISLIVQYLATRLPSA